MEQSHKDNLIYTVRGILSMDPSIHTINTHYSVADANTDSNDFLFITPIPLDHTSKIILGLRRKSTRNIRRHNTSRNKIESCARYLC